MRTLALVGSLRAGSTNRKVLQAAQHLLLQGESMAFYEGLAHLPHYSPELDVDPLPRPVEELRSQVEEAEAVLICSPEYAGGVPGTMKTGLDCLVGSTAMLGKPTASINASPWSRDAQPSLLKTLGFLGAKLVEKSCVDVPGRGRSESARELSVHPEIGPKLESALQHLRVAVHG